MAISAKDQMSSGSASQPEHLVAATRLKAGSVGLPAAVTQSVVTMSPAITVVLSVPFLVGTAGIVSPLAIFGGAAISMLLGYLLGQLARHMTSAGTYYTYVSRTVGARVGFLVAWVYLLFYPVAVAQIGGFLGATLHSVLGQELGWNFPWWVASLGIIALVGILAFRGIEISVKTIVILGVLELSIMMALALCGLFDPGPGGTTLDWVNVSNAASGHGFFLAIVFSVFSFTGWDAAAPLAEETTDPQRNIPRAVIGSLVILAIFATITTWGTMSGWGTDHLGSFAGAEEPPAILLAHKYFHGLWWLVLLAFINSAVGAAIACTNASVRIFYGMARTGVIPSWLARIHHTHRTPANAVYFQSALNVILGLGVPIAIGVGNMYTVIGLIFTFALIPVYIMGNVGVFLLYRFRHPDEFNPIKHVLIPLLASAALVVVGYESLNPMPEYPLNLSAPIVLAWLAVGATVLVVMLRRGRSDWLAKAGEAVAEVPEGPRPVQAEVERYDAES
jgi:amino acid transporter